MTHHMHVGDYEHDLDLQSIEDLGLHDPLTKRTILRHMLTPFLGLHLRYYLSWNLSRGDGLGFQLMKMGLLLAAVIFAAIAPLTTLLFVFVPYALVYSSLNYWADCIDHAGLIGGTDDLDASRNVEVPRFIRAVFFPQHDCFHLVHHLFPNVPARHLEQTHQSLCLDGTYVSKQNARASFGWQRPALEEEAQT